MCFLVFRLIITFLYTNWYNLNKKWSQFQQNLSRLINDLNSSVEVATCPTINCMYIVLGQLINSSFSNFKDIVQKIILVGRFLPREPLNHSGVQLYWYWNLFFFFHIYNFWGNISLWSEQFIINFSDKI